MTSAVRVSSSSACHARHAEPSPQIELLSLLESRVHEDEHSSLGRSVTDASTLAFLARHGGPVTRRAVAGNRATPVVADFFLLRDEDPHVRAQTARKMGWRFFRAGDDDPYASQETILAGIERLAQDPDPAVRAVLSHEVRNNCGLPPALIWMLARDHDTAVAAPVLECSPLLSEEQLLSIVEAGTSLERAKAIARSRALSADFCDSFIIHVDPRATAVLVANAFADIRVETLDHIAHAPGLSAWCIETLAMRPELSLAAVRSIACLAGRRTLERLAARALDDETRQLLRRELAAREEAENLRSPESIERAAERVREALREYRLTDGFVLRAVDRCEIDVVVAAIAEPAGLTRGIVRRLLAATPSSAVLAVVRHAGFEVRTAYRILELATSLGLRTKPRPAQRPRASERRRESPVRLSLAVAR